MTFFHEIGHSMNADHDDAAEFKNRQKECNPSDEEGGSYLMFPTGTEGLLPNNRAYSHCSLDTISYVLKEKKIYFYFHKSIARYSILRKYTEILGQWKPKCLSTTKKVKGKCDGIFSSDEACDEYGTSSNCCTSDCKLKTNAACSPASFLFERKIDKKNQQIFSSSLVCRFMLRIFMPVLSRWSSVSS